MGSSLLKSSVVVFLIVAVISYFTAKQEKRKPKATDLFDGEGEDGDLFSNAFTASAQSKGPVEDQIKHPEKKVAHHR